MKIKILCAGQYSLTFFKVFLKTDITVQMKTYVYSWDHPFIVSYDADICCGVKSGIFGHQVNSDTHLQTVEIQMRRLLMSRLIRIFTVCLVNLFFIPITEL